MEVRLPVPGGLAWRLSALGLVVAVATAISYLVFAFAPQERARAIDRWRAQLSAMASDRQSAIDSWLGEKLADARTVAGYPTVLRLVGTADTLPASSRGGQELRTHLGDVLRSLVRNGGYRGAALLDAQGRLLMSVGPEPELRADCLALPRRALAARRSLAELHLHAGARPLIQLAAPIGSEARAAPVGVVLLSVDPEDWLYPFLRSQPLASESEETLLAGREGASIVLLSPLRYRPDPPMTLRLPLTTPRLVAAAAFQGGGKFGDYADYRGEAVLAVTRELATMPWQLVAKVDRSEALAGVRENVMQATLALFGVCVALASSFLCTWRALRARAQARLARAEARLSFLLDQASDVILVVDADGRIRDANERAVELYGHSREALCGLHVSELLRDQDRELIRQRNNALLEQGRLVWESTHVTRDGQELPVEVASRSVELDGERLSVSIVRDISERRRAEVEIRRLNSDLERRVAERTSELACLNQELQGEVEGRARMQLAVERYAREVEDLYNHAPCGYHSLDADGRFVTVNDTELEWLGYTRDELLGRSVQDVLFPSARETFAAHYPEFKLRGTLRDLELEMRRKDGSRFWALLNATAVRDEEGGYLRSRSTMFDITDLVQARQEVARRTAALEAANRELESFSYSVSHDLRAPLRAIAGFSSLLASDYSGQLDAEAKGLLDRVCDNTRRMSQLIDDLLAFSGVGRKQMHQGRLSMNGLVAACVAELTAGLDPSRLEIEVGALPDAFGDAAMLRQVWTNLLSNALKFTSQRPRARVLVRGGSVNGERVYSVEDNGVGFDKRYAGKLFGVFQRLHNQREFPGTGVGLALVQRVVERHGGRIWADSRPGEGATFSFALPAPPPESSASD